MSIVIGSVAEKKSTQPELVRFEHVNKSYGDNQVLNDVSLTVNHSEIVCLIGPSGGGKSTLLRSINHLCEIDSGSITVGGELVGAVDRGGVLYKRTESDIARMRAKVGMVFQHFNLFANFTALENIVYAQRVVHRKSKKDATRTAYELLELVGLQEHAGKRPVQLSGGQQQRVAIARALAIDPMVCLFDEPTSALDPELVGDVLDVMRRLAREGLTMMIATHEITFARDIADRVLVLDGGEIIESGHPSQVIDAPANPRTQAFLARLHAIVPTGGADEPLT